MSKTKKMTLKEFVEKYSTLAALEFFCPRTMKAETPYEIGAVRNFVWMINAFMSEIKNLDGVMLIEYPPIKKVVLDGKEEWKLQCPRCHEWGYLDDDQYHGRVSTQCSCGYHETIDFSKWKGTKR